MVIWRQHTTMRTAVLASFLFAAAASAQPNCPPVRFLEAAQRQLSTNGEIAIAVLLDQEYAGHRRRTSPPYPILGLDAGFGQDFGACVPHQSSGRQAVRAKGRRLGEPASLIRALPNLLGPEVNAGVWSEFRNGTVAVLLTNPDHTLRERVVHNVGAFPQVILDGDYNRDGRTDLAVLYGGRILSGQRVEHGGISLLMGGLDGAFASATNVAISGTALGFAQHDLNGDGRLDFVVAHLGDSPQVGQTGTISALLSTGSGTFTASELAKISFPRTVTIADLNADGRLDIAVAAAGLPLLLGNGDGTFRAPANLAAGHDPSTLTTGDLNHDGVPDLITARSLSGTVSVLLGRGGGAYDAPVTYVAGIDPDSLIITDFDGDGNTDVVVGDGIPEALTPAGSEFLYVLFGNGDGSLAGAPSLQPGDTSLSTVAAGDFNGDGRDDIALGGGQRFAVYLSPASGRFPAPRFAATAGFPNAAVARDLNGDQRADLAYISGASLNGLLSNGDGTFRQAAPRTTVSNGTAIAAGDFNGDGRVDVAVTGGGGVTVHLGGGDGTFQAGAAIATGSNPVYLVSGDWNGDRADDLAVVNNGEFGSATNPGNLTVLVGNGNGTFRAPVRLDAGLNPRAAAAGDLDGDGDLDLAVSATAANFGNNVHVFSGAGDGSFTAAGANPTDFGPGQLAIDDFSGDGRADVIVMHCCGSTSPGFYLGTGRVRLAVEEYFTGASDVSSFARGDFNDDGRPDLALLSQPTSSTPSAAVLLNTAAPPSFTSVTAAGFEVGPVAPQSIVSAFGTGLAASTAAASSLPLPTSLGGATLRVRDAVGGVHDGPLFFASPNQINYLWPASSAIGRAVVTIAAAGGGSQTATVQVQRVAPGLFIANQQRLAAALVLRVRADGSQSVEPVARNENGAVVAATIDFGPESDQLFLLLFGTGFRRRTALDRVKVLLNGQAVQPTFAGAQGEFEGLDQANIPLPRQFRGRGDVTVQLEVEGTLSNVATLRM